MAYQRTFGFNRVLATAAPIPNAGVAVYDEGTNNLSTIFADILGTPKANPFTSDENGYWFFYAINGRYDVALSTATGNFIPGSPTNYTLGDIEVASFVSLNGLTSDSQDFATGIAGGDFNIVSSGSTHTFNIPDAGPGVRGLVNASTQTFDGVKTFSTPIAIPSGGTGLGTAPTNGQLLIGNAGAWAVASLTGTANQIIATPGAGTLTLSTPQNIHTGASPTFAGLTISGFTANSFIYSGGASALGSTGAPTAGQFLVSPGGGGTPLLGTLAGSGGTTVSYAAGTWTITSPSGTGITSLNGLVGVTQTFAVGTAGSDFNISSSGTVHTFNIPDAGVAARGILNAGAQSIGGLKTFPSGIQTQGVSSSLSTVGNSGAAETTLASYSLPANTLATTGTMCKIIAWGHTTNNANAKTVKMYFGATVILSLGLTVSETGSWYAGGEVYAAGASAQRAFANGGGGPSSSPGTSSSNNVSQPAEASSGTILIKTTGTATTNNDITLEGMIVSLCI